MDELFDVTEGRMLVAEVHSHKGSNDSSTSIDDQNDDEKIDEETPLVPASINNEYSNAGIEDEAYDPYGTEANLAIIDGENDMWADQIIEVKRIKKVQRKIEVLHSKRVYFFLNACLTFIF